VAVFLSQGQVTGYGPDVYADATPPWSTGMYYGSTGLELVERFAAYGALYKQQTWVYTVVRKLAVSQARLPLKSDNQQLLELLRRPNPKMDGYSLQAWTRSTREIYGEAMWLKIRDRNGRPRELWPLHPTNLTVRRNQSGGREYLYLPGHYSASTAEVVFPEEDIVHFKSYNPDGPERGLSPLEPLRMTLLNEDASRRATQAFWSNGARPSVLLSTDRQLSQVATERLKAQWEALHRGVDSFGKTAVLEEGMKPTVVQLNAEEMQYIDSRKLNREEVCGVYDVPPPVVHILDRATFSNITEQMRSMYRDTMAPRLGEDESTIDHHLGVDFGGATVLFSLDDVLRGSPEERAKANQAAVFSAQKTPNEARAEGGLEPLPGGDKLYINAAAIPLEAAAVSPPPGTTIEQVPVRVRSLRPVDEEVETA
jgi:HK97 family phage portal protein